MTERGVSVKLFELLNHTLLFVLAMVSLLPFLYILLHSFQSEGEALSRSFVLIPKEYSLEAYRYIFSSDTALRSIGVSVFITVAGTAVNLVFTVLMAYPLAKKELKGRRIIMLLILFTILFNSGIIPLFLVVKMLGLLDSYWSLILPAAISPFNLIVLRTFFQQMPEGIEESATIDGCNELQTLLRIVLPLSLPAIATFGLFYAVQHWNAFFSAIMFINDSEKWPVQVLLRQIVILASGGLEAAGTAEAPPPSETVKMAIIIVSTLPILLVYPFLQKHFAKGVLLGSVKG